MSFAPIVAKLKVNLGPRLDIQLFETGSTTTTQRESSLLYNSMYISLLRRLDLIVSIKGGGRTNPFTKFLVGWLQPYQQGTNIRVFPLPQPHQRPHISLKELKLEGP
jgi:hypothetical protein